VGEEVGAPLTQVSTRLLVWWLDMARDVRPGDELEVVYELPEGQEPLVHALRYTSGKLGKEVRAYRYQAPGARFARYYDEEGAEIEQRLVGGPVDDYEQVTSLLRDGRGHKGVDFKTPVGTPVHATFAGVVKRRNWNFHGNGNCLEIEDAKGRRSMFLHLSEIEPAVRPGVRVKPGQLVAHSGNTGRSTAPHLHYQLMSAGDRVMDPFDVHATKRLSLNGEALAGFRTERARLDGLLGKSEQARNP
jgi:murein DD-endopeptidase